MAKKKPTMVEAVTVEITVNVRDLGILISAAFLQSSACRVAEAIGLDLPLKSNEIVEATKRIVEAAEATCVEAGVPMETVKKAINAGR